MSNRFSSPGYLTGQFLIAMPGTQDARFSRSLVYVCAHSAEGAMGLIVNRSLDNITFSDLLTQLSIATTPLCDDVRVHFGGPVDAGRGFVLHSNDYHQGEHTLMVDENTGLTATVDILRAIAAGKGPRRSMLALGYAGWNAGQLDEEILENSWLNVAADEGLLFNPDIGQKWQQAISKLGIDLSQLSGFAGHA